MITSTSTEIISSLAGNIKFSLRKALGIKIDKISAYNKRSMDFGPTRQRMMSEESRKINYRQSLVNSNSRSLTEGHPAFTLPQSPFLLTGMRQLTNLYLY